MGAQAQGSRLALMWPVCLAEKMSVSTRSLLCCLILGLAASAPAAAQRPSGSETFLGYGIGEERRFVLGPPEALGRGESGVWAIRLEEVYLPGTESAEAVFALGHEWHAPVVAQEVPFRWITRVQSDGTIRVNPHGFPLRIDYATQRHLAGLGEEAYTIEYEFEDSNYEKRTTIMGKRWRDSVFIRGHDYLDKSVPAGMFAFLPAPPGCMDRRVTTWDQAGYVQPPQPRSGATEPAQQIVMPTTNKIVDNADCEESLFINPGLLSLAMPAFWEAKGDREFLFFTPIGPVGDRDTGLRIGIPTGGTGMPGGPPAGAPGMPVGQPPGGMPGSMGGSPGSLSETITPATYHEVERLRFGGDRVQIRVGHRSAEAWRVQGPDQLGAIYIDDAGVVLRIDLPKLHESQPQRWIRMLWPSEF